MTLNKAEWELLTKAADSAEGARTEVADLKIQCAKCRGILSKAWSFAGGIVGGAVAWLGMGAAGRG